MNTVPFPDEPYRHWQLTRPIRTIPGYAHGSRYPALSFNVTGQALPPDQRLSFARWLDRALPVSEFLASRALLPDETGDFWQDSVTLLMHVLQKLQLAAGLHVFERGRLLEASDGRAHCLAPTTIHGLHALPRTLEWVLDLFEIGADTPDDSRAASRIAQALNSLRNPQHSGANVPRFILSAYEMGLSIRELPGQVYHFGEGSRSRRLDSSFTDATPHIATRLARNKHLTSTLLRMSGLPVPEHGLVHTAKEARELAGRLGYPVVVKPADLDGGVGVSAGLASPEELVAAFDTARRKSRNVLVEKHVAGRDYRITVFQDQVVWAVERIPAGVTGDGHSTVRQLLDRLNADPLRSDIPGAPLKRIKFDAEAQALLLSQGLEPSSIVPAGHRVRLHRAANIASGGTPLAVFEHMHPDNQFLAVRAAQALGLDLAGIDLIMPDISRPWHSAAAGICEVNAQPNLGQLTAGHLYPQILRALIPKNGRIPTVVLVGPPDEMDIVASIAGRLKGHGLRTGYLDGTGVHLDGRSIAAAPITPFEAGQMLCLDRSTDAILLGVTDDSLLRTGLPFPRLDVLALIGDNVRPRYPQTDDKTPLHRLIEALLPACDGRVLHSMDSAGSVLPASSEPIHPQQISTAITEAILSLECMHREAGPAV